MSTIRPGRAEDVEAMVAIERVSTGSPWSETAFADELGRAVSRVLVLTDVADAEARASVLGFVVFWVVGDEAEVLNIAVNPSARRRGYGRSLLDAMLAASAELGAVRAFLDVRSENVPALGLYRARGFEAVGKRARYYRDTGEDAVIMALDLGASAA